MNRFSVIPAKNDILEDSRVSSIMNKVGKTEVKIAVEQQLGKIRTAIVQGEESYTTTIIKEEVIEYLTSLIPKGLTAVINGTGVLLHTNLGRALFSKEMMPQLTELLTNYMNLEFDLTTGKRGKRGEFVEQLFTQLTGAEACLIVNNNASAVYLILNELAKNREVIVSRGELVEIGGSFRVPDIMNDSGAILKEVGATNKTKLSDYERAINLNTSMLMKVHQSNFYISGFTHSAKIEDIISTSKEHNLISYYDIGAGLIKTPTHLENSYIEWGDSVKEIIELNIDLLSFSGDKILGGPQAGIILGKREIVERLRKNPLYRVLRVGKLTYSVLYSTISNYINFEQTSDNIPFFKMLNQSQETLQKRARMLMKSIDRKLNPQVVTNVAKPGGGALPKECFTSYAILIDVDQNINYHAHLELMKQHKPIVTILRDSKLVLDVVTLFDSDFDYIANSINNVYKQLI